MACQTIYTIGHSNRSLDDFITLLRSVAVQGLVDIRARPRSHHNPQFDTANLRTAMARQGMDYYWLGRQLGGLRKSSSESVHLALPEGLRSFADYMQGNDFKLALQQLLKLVDGRTIAIMCAESEPMHCHRSLIADALCLMGYEVVHILSMGELIGHSLRTEARMESGNLIYDRNQNLMLDI